MDWNDLKYFLAVARSGSLLEAGKKLQVSHPTVARRVAALEDDLGLELFAHKTTGYVLTEEGRNLMRSAEQAESHMTWIERGSRCGDDSGVVRLAMPELLGTHYIIPRLAGLVDQHHGIQFELSADVRSARLTKGEADVLVRLTRPDQGEYHVKQIGRIALGLFASAGYIEKFGSINDPRIGSRHRFIGWDRNMSYLPLAEWLAQRAETQHFGIKTHTMGSQFAAARAGIGIALLPALPARNAGLSPVSDDVLVSEVWMLLLDDIRNLKRFRLVADYLENCFHDDADALVRIS